MTLRHGKGTFAGDIPEEPHLRAFRYGVLEHPVVALASHPVEYHPLEVHPRVELLKTLDESADRPGGLPGVYDQQNRKGEQFGKVRRGALFATAVPAVEKPHNALDHRDIRAFSLRAKGLRYRIGAHHPCVEVIRRLFQERGVVAGVDVVGARLEWLDDKPPSSKRLHNAKGHHGLARPA